MRLNLPRRLPGRVSLAFAAALTASWAPAFAQADATRPTGTTPSGDVQRVAQWTRSARDHMDMPFAIIDKKAAAIHVFDGAGTLRASSPVLLGLARGDHSVPGIGDRQLSEIAPDERTTPAGRFASEPGRNLQGEDIVWIDYEAAISMHRVRANNKAERRLERLASATADDNRISYGCVNVPAAFYDAHLKPVFGAARAVIYILPETRAASELFGSLAETL